MTDVKPLAKPVRRATRNVTVTMVLAWSPREPDGEEAEETVDDLSTVLVDVMKAFDGDYVTVESLELKVPT